MRAIGGDQRHARADRAQDLVGGRGKSRRRGASRRGRRRNAVELRRRRGLEAERCEDLFVKFRSALEQFVDAAQVFAGLRTLHDAMIVGARYLHHFGDAQRAKRLCVRVSKARRIADRARCDDRTARRQPWHAGDRSETAGVGQRQRRARKIVGGQLVLARFHHEVFVRGAEMREVERSGGLDDRHDEEPRSVFAFGVDGQPQMHAAFDAQRQAVLVAPEACGDSRHLLGSPHKRVCDQMRERNLFGSPGRFDRRVEFRATRVEHVNRERAEAGRGRNGQALFHVARERRRRALELRYSRSGGNRRKVRQRSRRGRAALSRRGLREHVGSQDQSVRTGAANRAHVEIELARGAPGLRRCVCRLAARACGRGRPGYERGRFRRRRRRTGGRRIDLCQWRTDGDDVAFLCENLGDDARCRSRHFDVHFVGRDFDDGLAFADPIAGLLAKFDDRALSDGLAHLRQRDRDGVGLCDGAVSGGLGGRSIARGAGVRGIDPGEPGAHQNGRALVREDLGDHARGRGGNLDVDLVGGYFDKRIALGDAVADVLTPLDDGAFGDRLAHLGQRHRDHRVRQLAALQSSSGCRVLRGFYRSQ